MLEPFFNLSFKGELAPKLEQKSIRQHLARVLQLSLFFQEFSRLGLSTRFAPLGQLSWASTAAQWGEGFLWSFLSAFLASFYDGDKLSLLAAYTYFRVPNKRVKLVF